MVSVVLGLVLIMIAQIAEAQIKNPTKWKFEAQDVGDGEADLRFIASLDEGWHVYSQFLGGEGPAPTEFVFEPSGDYERVGKVAEGANGIASYDSTFGISVKWYEKTAVFTQRVRMNTTASVVKGTVTFMVCTKQECLLPETIRFNVAVNVKEPFKRKAPLKSSQKSEQTKQKPPQQKQHPEQHDTPEPSVPEPKDQKLSAASLDVTNTAPAIITVSTDTSKTKVVRVSLSGVEDSLSASPEQSLSADRHDRRANGWIIFIEGFLYGLIALIMPCIFPMIPFTVAMFAKTSSRSTTVAYAIAYGVSLIVIYVGAGLTTAVIFGSDALNAISTNGVFNFVIFLLLLIFAASFLGAFEITLPARWTNRIDRKADKGGYLGLFFAALTLAIVSFSCTGPLIGDLLVTAAVSGSYLGPALGMLGFSLCLALVFIFFGIFPSLLKTLPKSGGWLNSIKVTMGFLELAFALKFLSNVDLAYHWNWFDREVFLVLWIIIFGLLGLYLLGKLKLAHDSIIIERLSVTRLFLAICTLAFTLYLIPGLWGAPLKVVAAFLPPQHTQDFDLYVNRTPSPQGEGRGEGNVSLSGVEGSTQRRKGGLNTQEKPERSRRHADIFHAPLGLTNTFFDYREGLAYAKQVNKPVMIDFTGHACVNCRKMEATIWPEPEVFPILKEEYVLIQLYVDDKTELPVSEQVISNYSGKQLITLGNKWSDFQASAFNTNSQPYYVLLDAEEKILTPPQGANYNAVEFAKFLQTGLDAYRNSQPILTASP